MMDCKEAQQKIIPYINGELSARELEDFLWHIRNCRECYDELEIYYILYAGLSNLDGKDERFDFQNMLKEALENSERQIQRKHFFTFYYVVSQGLAMLALLCVAVFAFVLRK